MRKCSLSDAEIRPALKEELRLTHWAEPDTVLLEELGVNRGGVRADVALVNGIIHGYEIKSDRDSLRRLATQVDLYGKCFDRATLVTGSRHLDAALALLPDWWGVMRVDAARYGTHFTIVRWPSDNPGRDARTLCELLWLDDAVALLKVHGIDRGVRGKTREVVWDRMSKCLDIEIIASAVRANLKARARQIGPRLQM